MAKYPDKPDISAAGASSLVEVIRDRSRPLQPIETGRATKLPAPGVIRAVLFDVYGTLLVSGSGDVGTARESSRTGALQRALYRSGIETKSRSAVAEGTELLFYHIKQHHSDMRRRGIMSPEVDILTIWRHVLAGLLDRGLIANIPDTKTIRRLAVEYECEANPAWPMPHARDTIETLSRCGKMLGIISNAQFFTPLFFQAFFETDIPGLGFSENLCFWSWQHGIAKPSPALHEKAAASLKDEYNIETPEALYVGNDMLNDILPAHELGFKTVLFAGDRRSLRLRDDRRDGQNVVADAVITDLRQLQKLFRQ